MLLFVCIQNFKFGTALLPKKQHLSVYIETMLDVIRKNDTLLCIFLAISFCENEVYNKLIL